MTRSDRGVGRLGDPRSSSVSAKLPRAAIFERDFRNPAVRWLARGRLRGSAEYEVEAERLRDEEARFALKLSSVFSSSHSLSDPVRDGVFRSRGDGADI